MEELNLIIEEFKKKITEELKKQTAENRNGSVNKEKISDWKRVISISLDNIDWDDLRFLKKQGFKHLEFDNYYIFKEVDNSFNPDEKTSLDFNSIALFFLYKSKRFNMEEKILEFVFE